MNAKLSRKTTSTASSRNPSRIKFTLTDAFSIQYSGSILSAQELQPSSMIQLNSKRNSEISSPKIRVLQKLLEINPRLSIELRNNTDTSQVIQKISELSKRSRSSLMSLRNTPIGNNQSTLMRRIQTKKPASTLQPKIWRQSMVERLLINKPTQLTCTRARKVWSSFSKLQRRNDTLQNSFI